MECLDLFGWSPCDALDYIFYKVLQNNNSTLVLVFCYLWFMTRKCKWHVYTDMMGYFGISHSCHRRKKLNLLQNFFFFYILVFDGCLHQCHISFISLCRWSEIDFICISVRLKMSLKRRLMSMMLCCAYCVASLFCLHPNRNNCFSTGAWWVFVCVVSPLTALTCMSAITLGVCSQSVYELCMRFTTILQSYENDNIVCLVYIFRLEFEGSCVEWQ